MTISVICPHWSAFAQRGNWVLARCDSPTPVEGWEGDVAEKCVLGYDANLWREVPATMIMHLAEDGQMLTRGSIGTTDNWDRLLACFQGLSVTDLDAVPNIDRLRRLFRKKRA